MRTFLGDMTIRAPNAAPAIVTISAGWMSAAKWPPAIAKPPSTAAITMILPTMTIMVLKRNRISIGGTVLIGR